MQSHVSLAYSCNHTYLLPIYTPSHVSCSNHGREQLFTVDGACRLFMYALVLLIPIFIGGHK